MLKPGNFTAAITSIDAAMQQQVGILRGRLADLLSAQLPDSGYSMEEFNVATSTYINTQAGRTIINPLVTDLGPEIPNLDLEGRPKLCAS